MNNTQWLLSVFLVSLKPLAAEQVPDDFRYQVEVLDQTIRQPMELELAPDGRLFVNDFKGGLHIVDPASDHAPVLAGRLKVFNEQENGFLGFALDPAFETNHWIYCFYSPQDFSGQRLSRFRMEGEMLLHETEKVLLEFAEQREQCCHHAGSVEFAPDGCLLISTGDNTFPGAPTGGSAPIDERPGKGPWDAQKSSANTHDLRGKILRIRPTPEGGYEIPEGNLFPRDGSDGCPEIYIMGCRNPWRMSVDEQTGFVYWGEVGPDAGGDSERGPRGYDELNQAKAAGNFGWPYFVGNNFAYAEHDFATSENGPRYDPIQPINNSPNNNGRKMLPPAQPALIYWPYGASAEFPILGSGGRTACAGPVFYHQPTFEETQGFPAYYDHCLLFWDWQRPFLFWARLDAQDQLVGIEPFSEAVLLRNDGQSKPEGEDTQRFLIQRPIDAEFGPDGCLYLLDYGRTWGANEDARVLKISYLRGNMPPRAMASIQPDAGKAPLKVTLSAAGSHDLDGHDLAYRWTLHPSGQTIASGKDANIELKDTGNHVIALEVRDAMGASASVSLPISIGNARPSIDFETPQDGDFLEAHGQVTYQLRVRDQEDGDSRLNDEFMEAGASVMAQPADSNATQATIPPGHQAMLASDCFNCHAIAEKVVGPALLDIAQRYRHQPEALTQSVQRVLKGSAGVWGEVPMLAHANLAEQQVEAMVQWIYDLEPSESASTTQRGLQGKLELGEMIDGKPWALKATYRDFGWESVAPLTATATIHLRHRRIEAEHCDDYQGLRILGNKLGAIEHGSYARFRRIPFHDVGKITIRVASGGAGGQIIVREGSPDGPVVTSFEVTPTGGYDQFVEKTSPPLDRNGRSDLFLCFVNPGKGGLMDVDWVECHPAD